MVWLGNNDILGMATSTDPNAIDRPVAQFGQLYRQLLNRLADAGVDMAVGEPARRDRHRGAAAGGG